MTLNLVEGEFSTLEDALRKQVQVLEAELEQKVLAEKWKSAEAGTKAEYWEHLYKEADAKRDLLQEKSQKLLLMVAKRDEKIQDLEIPVEGHRESIREYKHELEKLQADKELNKGIIHGQSEVINDLRSQLETPINFDDD